MAHPPLQAARRTAVPSPSPPQRAAPPAESRVAPWLPRFALWPSRAVHATLLRTDTCRRAVLVAALVIGAGGAALADDATTCIVCHADTFATSASTGGHHD